MNESSVRVLIVDDQPPFRDAAKVVFELLDRFEVIGEAGSGEEAVHLVAELQPDLVVMDINLPGINGVDATREVTTAHPDTVVVLVSTYEANALPRDAASCGALAYIHKEQFDPDLVEQVWDERSTTLWRTA